MFGLVANIKFLPSVFVGAPAQGGPARGGQQISLRTRGGQPPLGPEKVDFGALALRARGGRQGGQQTSLRTRGCQPPCPPLQRGASKNTALQPKSYILFYMDATVGDYYIYRLLYIYFENF